MSSGARLGQAGVGESGRGHATARSRGQRDAESGLGRQGEWAEHKAEKRVWENTDVGAEK